MSFIFEDNEQLIIEIKKLLLEENISQREVANRLNITPQSFTKLINKKNFSFEDAKKILDVLGYDLSCSFQRR